MRHLVHLAVVVSAIVAVRACGGANVAEDRMTANTRWMADKTGVTDLRIRWREHVAPSIAKTMRTVPARAYQVANTALERLGAIDVKDSIDSGAAKAAATVKEAAGGESLPGASGSK